MARNITPILKQSRREKTALHPKAIKLREKQKVKRMYGLLEKQFARVVHEAERRQGVTGDTLIQLLEQRLDNAVYRLGLATSRQASRQLVTHGHFLLNGRRVDIPSILLKPGDEIQVRPKSAANVYFKTVVEQLAGNAAAIRWLSFDSKKLTAKVTGLPAREDVSEEIREQLIIEFYSR
jgi:small subunit ribosomal protein S4